MRSITIAGKVQFVEKHGTKTIVRCGAILPSQQSITFNAWMFGKRAESLEIGSSYLFDGDLRVDEDNGASFVVDSASATSVSAFTSFCTVSVSSRLTKDVEVKHFERGVLTSTGMVINHAKDGQPLWLKLNFWGVIGEKINQYFKKGDPIEIVGTLKLEQWESQGETRSAWVLIGRSWSFPISPQKEPESISAPKKEPEYSDDF